MLLRSALIRKFLIVLISILTISFSVFYLSHSHKELVKWYLDINGKFYWVEYFKSFFFTEKTKSNGDIWSMIAIAAALIGPILIWKIQIPKAPTISLSASDKIEYLIISISAILVSIFINSQSLYAYDEVFSAVNFASLPSFQCLAHYPLPNNHIFFNLINGLLFSWHDDYVFTGRVISMFAYVVTLLITWNFLKKWINAPWKRWIILASLALQFPAWGFSAQARGYELVLMLSMIGFTTFWSYWVEGKKHVLTLHFLTFVFGMLTMPIYLYWSAGLFLAAFFMMIARKEIDWIYIRGMIACGMLIFITYLPLLTFSGLASVTDNQYTKGSTESSWNFFLGMFDQWYYLRGLMGEWFCFDLLSKFPGVILMILPVILVWFRKEDKNYRNFVIIYISFFIAFVAVTIYLKTYPYNRNMIAHGYMIWMVILISIFSSLKQVVFIHPFSMKNLLNLERPAKFTISLSVLLAISIFFSTYENLKRNPSDLYGYTVKGKYSSLEKCQFEIQPNSTVFLDNESFYWWYVLRKKFPNSGIKTESNRFRNNHQDYSVWQKKDRTLVDTTEYKIISDCEEFLIYERRR